jgi:hypothetical protein
MRRVKEQPMSSHLTDWNQPEWHEYAHEWIRSELSRMNITVTGTIEQIHNQPWSTVLKIPTNQGNVFFKASTAILLHEAGVTDYLSKLNRADLPRVLTADASRGWMIMNDGGTRLRETLIANPDIQRWVELMPLYADLQIELSNHLDAFHKLNVPDSRLNLLPQIYQNILADTEAFRIDSEDGVTAAEYGRLQDLVSVVTEKCQQLANYAVPESLHHGDLHDGNIFYNNGQYLFFDWSDCTVTHPFFSLRTAYVSAEMRFNLEEYDPILNRLRDAYLVPWRKFETEARLLEVFGLAMELWAISSMFNWYKEIKSMDETQQKDFVHVIPSLSKELLALIKA